MIPVQMGLVAVEQRRLFHPRRHWNPHPNRGHHCPGRSDSICPS